MDFWAGVTIGALCGSVVTGIVISALGGFIGDWLTSRNEERRSRKRHATWQRSLSEGERVILGLMLGCHRHPFAMRGLAASGVPSHVQAGFSGLYSRSDPDQAIHHLRAFDDLLEKGYICPVTTNPDICQLTPEGRAIARELPSEYQSPPSWFENSDEQCR